MRRFALVVGLWAAVSLPACSQEPDPVQTARSFVSAVRSGDSEVLLTLIDAEAVARADQSARRATDQVGGRRSIETREVIQVADPPRHFQVAQAELLDEDGEIAHVKLTGVEGEEYVLELVMQDGAWRVRIPTPALPQP